MINYYEGVVTKAEVEYDHPGCDINCVLEKIEVRIGFFRRITTNLNLPIKELFGIKEKVKVWLDEDTKDYNIISIKRK